MFNEGNQIHNFISSSGSGTIIHYGSGSDFLTSYGSGSTTMLGLSVFTTRWVLLILQLRKIVFLQFTYTYKYLFEASTVYFQQWMSMFAGLCVPKSCIFIFNLVQIFWRIWCISTNVSFSIKSFFFFSVFLSPQEYVLIGEKFVAKFHLHFYK